MNDNTFNWKSFKRKIYIDRSKDDLFEFISKPSGMMRWFIEFAFLKNKNGNDKAAHSIAEAGDTYFWKWTHGFELTGNILDTDGNSFVLFDFGGAGNVKISVGFENDRNFVEMVQEVYSGKEYDNRMHVNCYANWSFYLTNLKSIAETGYDLREKKDFKDELVN